MKCCLKKGSVSQDINCDDQEFERTFICISQNENCDDCPQCLCKPCITDEQNRQILWSSEPELPDRKIVLFERKNINLFGHLFFHRGVFLDNRYTERGIVQHSNQTRDLELL